MLSLIPLDFLYIIWGPECVILRIPRFFKCHTFWEFFSLIDKLLSNPYVIRISRTLMYMMYLIHLNACAYYSFSTWEGIGSNHFVFNGKGNAYIKCFYFATKTATSIGKLLQQKMNDPRILLVFLYQDQSIYILNFNF